MTLIKEIQKVINYDKLDFIFLKQKNNKHSVNQKIS